MGHSGGFERISSEKAKIIAKKKGLQPGRVIGTDIVHLTKGTERLTIISWEEFESILKKRKLALYEWGGFMKIMKDH